MTLSNYLTHKKTDTAVQQESQENLTYQSMVISVGGIESAELDGYGDGLVTDVTLEIEVPKMKEYYEQEIRNKAIEKMKELVRGHKYVNAEDGTTVEEMLKDENTEEKYAWYLSRNQCCDWMLHRLDEIAEQMKGERENE